MLDQAMSKEVMLYHKALTSQVSSPHAAHGEGDTVMCSEFSNMGIWHAK